MHLCALFAYLPCSGRTQREALDAASALDRPEQEVNRAPSRKYNRRPSQSDVSLKNVAASEDVCLENSLASPNGVLLRLSPQPANRCALSTSRSVLSSESTSTHLSAKDSFTLTCFHLRTLGQMPLIKFLGCLS